MSNVFIAILSGMILVLNCFTLVHAEELPTLESLPKVNRSSDALTGIEAPTTAALIPANSNAANTTALNLFDRNQISLQVDERIQLVGKPQTVVDPESGINRITNTPDEMGLVRVKFQFEQ